MSELSNFLNVIRGSAKSIKYGMKISALLHRDDSKLVFFIDPHEESLSVIMENSSAFRPVSIQVASL
jgi:hypothetical protein